MRPYFLPILALFSVLFVSCGPSEPQTSPLEDEINAIENGLLKAVVVKGAAGQQHSLEDRMAFYNVPGVSIAVVREGKLHWARGYGIANTQTQSPITTTTLFQAGSISKPIAALAVMKLMEEGKVDLDTDVNEYLQGWKLEENEFTADKKVTLRRLLTHTAGTTVHGFPGYTQTDTFPSLIEVLNGEGNTPPIYVDTPPDSIWRYSGGGYTIMEKVVEEVSGMPLEAYMAAHILEPLGMENSTYAQPLPEQYHAQASAAYDGQGELYEGLWHNYPEQAAAGLWTTPTDLAQYYTAIQGVLGGTQKSILSKETIELMLTEHRDNWGLGPSVRGEGDSLRFGHSGKNAGFTNNMFGFAYLGSAFIIMTNADNGGELMTEIVRAISRQYELDLISPREVELAEEDTYDISQWVGIYRYVEQVPGVGDYLIELQQKGDTLIVLDPNSNDRDEMLALNSEHFINLENGNEVALEVKGDSVELNWNGGFQFYRVE